jgi:hypothetical protein
VEAVITVRTAGSTRSAFAANVVSSQNVQDILASQNFFLSSKFNCHFRYPLPPTFPLHSFFLAFFCLRFQDLSFLLIFTICSLCLFFTIFLFFLSLLYPLTFIFSIFFHGHMNDAGRRRITEDRCRIIFEQYRIVIKYHHQLPELQKKVLKL